ncbi:MAG: hypothetical protein II625_02575 [Bacilli bacterium]|nr:hypothetical protein [Bacilli bacterium]
MDKLKEKIDEIVKKIKDDKDFASKFTKNPTETIENTLGINVPEEQVEKIIDAVKAKLANDKITDAVKDVGNTLKGLFK